jgi:hypothetical protein
MRLAISWRKSSARNARAAAANLNIGFVRRALGAEHEAQPVMPSRPMIPTSTVRPCFAVATTDATPVVWKVDPLDGPARLFQRPPRRKLDGFQVWLDRFKLLGRERREDMVSLSIIAAIPSSETFSDENFRAPQLSS